MHGVRFIFLSLLFCVVLRAGPFSWREYGNNYDAMQAITEELVKTVGIPARFRYPGRSPKGEGASALGGTEIFEMPFEWTNQQVRSIRHEDPATELKLREAWVTFVIAHEYFHIALEHTKTKKVVIDGRELSFSEQRFLFEKQVDYLAAKYVLSKGLSLEPAKHYLRTVGKEGGDTHPPGEERAQLLEAAKADTFDWSLFPPPRYHCTAAHRWLMPSPPQVTASR